MPLSSDQLIEGLVQEANAATIAEQRLRQRLPFFRPASITLDDAESTEFSGFTRDISSGGVGLLHQTPLDMESVNVGIWTVTGRRDDICLKIRWCNSVGQGWYVSGGQFTGLSVQQSVSLLLTSVGNDIGRRLKQRYPFFRPVSIAVNDSEQEKVSGFITDISLDGVGLLHDAPLEPCSVIVSIPTKDGDTVDIRMHIRWSAAIGSEWYVGGAQFMKMDFGEMPGRLL
jgi:hypothetical protein